MPNRQFVYDEDRVRLYFLLDEIQALLSETDIDKFTYFYVHGERGPDCLFAKVAYQRTNDHKNIQTALEKIEQVYNEYIANQKERSQEEG